MVTEIIKCGCTLNLASHIGSYAKRLGTTDLVYTNVIRQGSFIAMCPDESSTLEVDAMK